MNVKRIKILITGAPSSGKSTTLKRLYEVLDPLCKIVPEGAAILLAGGFPTPMLNDVLQIKAFQETILEVQSHIEYMYIRQNPKVNFIIFDRGILDGAAFWPLGIGDFLSEFKIDKNKEINNYDYVLFFELPTLNHYGGKNRLRFHDYEQSLECEKRLKQIWLLHPKFIEIKATEIFEDKIKNAIAIIKAIRFKHP